MESNFAIIWLLVTALIFVYFSKSFSRENPAQAIWLLAFAAAWPFILVYLAIAATIAVFLPVYWRV